MNNATGAYAQARGGSVLNDLAQDGSLEGDLGVTSRRAKIQEDTYFRIMRILQNNPELTQRELADKLGISVGRLNYCLNALIEKGFVKMTNFQKSKNKFKYVYLLTPQGVAGKARLTSRFLKRKMDEYEALKVEIEALKSEVGDDEVHGLGKLSR